MLNVHAKEADIYFGTEAGKEIHNDLLYAERSVVVISPYLSEQYVDLLLRKKKEKRLDIILITSSDFEKHKDAEKIYRLLVNQHRHTSEKRRKQRTIGLWIVGLTYAASIVVTVAGLYFKLYSMLWAVAGLPAGAFVKNIVDKIRVYTYTYTSNLPFFVTASPHSEEILRGQVFVHSKLYIIDGKVAYVGSANFTKAGFDYNYESVVKITDEDAIKQIYYEVKRLLDDEHRVFRNIDRVGGALYPEPIN